MIELLLKLIDRLIDLTKYQAERLEKTFHDILEPMFNDLLVIHTNYIKMFEEVLEKLKAIPDISSEVGVNELHDIADDLRRKRLEFEPVRIKARAIANELNLQPNTKSNIVAPEARDFVDKALGYLPSGSLANRSTASSKILRLLYSHAGMTTEELKEFGPRLREVVKDTIEERRWYWQLVCESYAKLKIAIRANQ